MLNGIVDFYKVRAQKVVTSSQSSWGVASSLAARKTDSRLKCLRRVCGNRMKKCGDGMNFRGSGMTSTLSNKLSFKLVDLTILFAIDHLANKLLIHCITTCIANGVAVRNSSAAVSSSPPPLPHFGSPLGALVRFLSLVSFSSFILMFFTRCRFFIHCHPVTHIRTSSTARREVVAPTPTTQTTVMA
jgi:hypothetical protein